MRRAFLATSIIAAGVALGVASPAAAATDGQLSLGQSCNGSQASLVVNINEGQGQEFDVLLDGDLIVDNIGGNSGTQVQVDDGIYTISLVYAPDGVVQVATIGVSCGEPAIAASGICIDDFGGLSVVSVPGSAGQFDLYVDGKLYEANIGDSTWGSEHEGFPDGTYLVGVKINGQSEFLYVEEITIDCVEGDGGQPASFDVDSYCDGSGYITFEIQSFTFGELFTITIDGVDEVDEMLSGYRELSAVSDGAHHVVITSSTAGVIYDDTILMACTAPATAARATCEAGVGELWFKALASSKGFSFFVSVDGVDVENWQDAPDTEGVWETLGNVAEGDHTVLIEWTHDEEDDGSDEILVTVDCTDDGSGTPLPDSGSNTTPIMLLAGGLMAAGALLLATRRIRHS